MNHSCDRVVILDFETTGLSGSSDRIIEVGAVAYDSGRLSGEFAQLLNPGLSLSHTTTSITGITDEMLEGKPRPEEIMTSLKNFIGDRIVIAHNANFDQKFLISEMARVGLKVDNPFLCTIRLARRLLPGHRSYSLSHLKLALGIHVQQSHRALDDARATARVWSLIVGVLKEKMGDAPLTLDFLEKLMKQPYRKVSQFLENQVSL